MKNKKKMIVFLIILIIIFVVGVFYWWKASDQKPNVVTADVTYNVGETVSAKDFVVDETVYLEDDRTELEDIKTLVKDANGKVIRKIDTSKKGQFFYTVYYEDNAGNVEKVPSTVTIK